MDFSGQRKMGVTSAPVGHVAPQMKPGFNAEGYDRQGFDRQGFNKAGWDREGYNRDGFDEQGFDRGTGFESPVKITAGLYHFYLLSISCMFIETFLYKFLN